MKWLKSNFLILRSTFYFVPRKTTFWNYVSGGPASFTSVGAGVEDDPTGVDGPPTRLTFIVGGLYFLSSLSLFSFHHTSACCSWNLLLLLKTKEAGISNWDKEVEDIEAIIITVFWAQEWLLISQIRRKLVIIEMHMNFSYSEHKRSLFCTTYFIYSEVCISLPVMRRLIFLILVEFVHSSLQFQFATNVACIGFRNPEYKTKTLTIPWKLTVMK